MGKLVLCCLIGENKCETEFTLLFGEGNCFVDYGTVGDEMFELAFVDVVLGINVIKSYGSVEVIQHKLL